MKRFCSVSRVARAFCQRAAGSFRRSRFVPKFVWMKLILISLNGVRLPSAIPLDRVAATRGGYRRSVLAREHVRERERERESQPALSAPRRIARSSRVTGTCLCVRTVCNCHSPRGTPRVCRGDISARSISVCEKMRRTRTDDEPGNFSPERFLRQDIYRRRGSTWTVGRAGVISRFEITSDFAFSARFAHRQLATWYVCVCVCVCVRVRAI